MTLKYLVLAILTVSLGMGMTDTFAQIVEDSITVQTDKPFYSDGETIVITGEVRDLYSGTPVSVFVNAPNGNLVSISNLEVSSDKKFNTEMTAGGALMKSEGTYTVLVQYGTANRSSETTFYFEGTTSTTPPYSTSQPSKDKGSITIRGHSDKINYEIEGGGLLSITADEDFKSLIVRIDSSSDGFIILDIPRNVLDSTFNGKEKSFIILLDGDEPSFYQLRSDYDSRKIKINFDAGSEEIEIIGSSIFEYQTLIDISTNESIKFTVDTSRNSYTSGDIIKITGSVSPLVEYSQSVTIVVVSPDGNIVTIIQVIPSSDGSYSTVSGTGTMNVSGEYEVRAQYGSQKVFDTFVFTAGNISSHSPCGSGTVFHPISNSCVLINSPTNESPYSKQISKSKVTIVPDTNSGSSVDDCTNIKFGCFIPGTTTVDLGGKVIFSNTDSTAHTFTAGTAADGPTGEFDTSLVMAGNSYEWIADVEGEIPYLCLIHPWMDGIIIIGKGTSTESNSKCGAGTVFDDASNSCILDSPSKTSNDNIISDLKKEITSLKLENRDLKRQISELQSEINELTDLLINGFKEIYAWKSNQ